MSLHIFFGALCLLSLLLTLWQWIVARRFPLHHPVANGPLSPPSELPLPLAQRWASADVLAGSSVHAPRISSEVTGTRAARNTGESFAPGITLLKPLKGCDAFSEKCLRSWLTQNYPGPVQILFGVASEDDPVCHLVRELVRAHPECDAELFICSRGLGPNKKVSTLVQLQPHIKHEVVVISDADVCVPPDFLQSIVTPLCNSTADLVNCFYRLANPTTWPMRWEAVAINGDFWSQVLQAQSLKQVNFALGAVMATTRVCLERIGGFSGLLDYLADDYQLGHKIAQRGGRIVFCPVVVECWSPPMRWKEVWGHQLRWARTIRICQPVPYFFSILSNVTLWALLWLASTGTPAVLSMTLAGLLIRVLSALDNQRKLTPKTAQIRYWWLVPVKDLLNAAIWFLAFLGNNIQWRGERYRVLTGGRLVHNPE